MTTLIHRRIETHAEPLSARIALRCGDQSISFGELHARATHAAAHVRQQGLVPGRLTALQFPRSVDAVVAALGVLEAGGAYVALDPNRSQTWTDAVIADARPLLMLTALPDAELDLPITADGSPDEAATITYTRDSMGHARGVIVTHRNLSNLIDAPPFAIDEDGVCALYFPLSAAAATAPLFASLCRGIPVQILSEAEVRDVNRLARTLASAHVTSVTLPAAVVRQFAKLEPEATLQLSPLRTVNVIGGFLPPDIIETLAAMLPDTTVREVYGPTEAGGAALVSDPTATSSYHERLFGQSIPNTRVYILDARLNIVPDGVDGEICIGADHLSPGYWSHRRPGSEPPVAEPFVMLATERVFRTGDTGRRLPDGRVELVGRGDDRVTIGGHRISVDIVEAVLQAHERVRDAAVSVQTDGGAPSLVAHVVAHGAAPTVSQLRGFLHARLPDYMVPATFVSIDHLPYNAIGEVDRRALPAPEQARPSSATPYVAPRNPIEAGLVAIWSEVLMLDRVGVHDDFLALGGDSLIATQAVARIWERFEVEIPFEAFFERATVAELAAAFFSGTVSGSVASDDVVSAG
jgi:acyl-CoA synthetase (AMP-forming)/AMP-acid ligase II/acyl carrier protein